MFADTKPMAMPNTFTFTKALSEAVVVKDGAGIPRSIIRPSMGMFLKLCCMPNSYSSLFACLFLVISCVNEPIKGYIDNWTAPSRYASIIGRGLKRSMYADKNIVMDLIPADLVATILISLILFVIKIFSQVVNMTLAAAWNVATHKYPFVPVFNISTGMINPITTKEMLSKLIPQFTRKYPLGRNDFSNKIQNP